MRRLKQPVQCDIDEEFDDMISQAQIETGTC
jgi:hypothetical protein